MSRRPQPAGSVRAYFGWRLRHWRRARGLSQAELGARLGYGDSHLSKVESGDRWPPPDLPDRADRVLDTGGELAALWPLVERERQEGPGARPVEAVPPSTPSSPTAPEAMAALLEAYHDVGSQLGSRDLVVPLEHHTRAVVQWQAGSSDPELARLAARFAQLAGWARFDGADYSTAQFWYTCGQHWATLADDRDLMSRLLARQSSVHWSVGNAAGAIALAERARLVEGTRPGVRAWACLAEARGHALAGDRRSCEQRLDDATTLLRAADPRTEPWAAQSVLALAMGTCYRDLAARDTRSTLATTAVDHTTRALAAVPVANEHDRAVVATRLASSHTHAGQPDEAASVLTTLLSPPSGPHGSARVRAEMRVVHTALTEQWPTVGAVRELTDLVRTTLPN
ncbi:transcriptional regulator with XRE-family HTH domain [Actinokineospora baliensis]|uniref:helix-turn-helix domain-containing protein n=1 Tax=Actinokineospora baliensis TaxID=547056 RepID=UPI00195860C8|nr:helix-turn-helix transcriptional regulator [Actinokineospora baliensis]MBM7773113.1 transcriptional regulator with XRE-family HTH domain [Actinokineospora baliensis]